MFFLIALNLKGFLIGGGHCSNERHIFHILGMFERFPAFGVVVFQDADR